MRDVPDMKNLVLLYCITDLIMNYQHFKLNYEMTWHDIIVFLRDFIGIMLFILKINFKA